MAIGGPPTIYDLKKLVRHLAKHGPFKTLPHPKRIRILFNGTFVADTTSALYVWEHEFYPQLYLPMHAFTNTPGVDVKLSYGDAIESDEGQIVGGEVKLAVRRTGTGFEEDYMVLEEMVLFAADLDGPANVLRDHVKVVFQAVDQWFEEDTPIYVHPKDPFKRIETLQSHRPIRITLPISPSENATTTNNNSQPDQIILAESPTSVHLYETTLPPRYYLPYTSLNTMYLHDSDTTSECPYKGVANYHNVIVDGKEYPDLVWWYRHPTADCLAVTGMRCFFNEKVDVWVKAGMDGRGEWEKLERVKTHFV